MTKLSSSDYECWMKAKSQLTYYKRLEMDLRTRIASGLVKSASDTGNHKFARDGYNIKVGIKLNITIDEDILEIIWDSLPQEEQDAVRFKPSLKKKEYDNLDDPKLMDALVSKPATPTLTIEHEFEGMV